MSEIDEKSSIIPGKNESYIFAEIDSIDHLGVIEIVFNETLKDVNMSRLNSSAFDIYIDPTMMKGEYRNLSVLNITWEVIAFDNYGLYIKVNFSDEV